VRWQDDANRDADLEALKPLAELGVALGNPYTTSGIMPANNDRAFDEQYAFVLERLTPFAQTLKDAGVSLGIEFIAPKTLRDKFTYEFIYSAPQMLELAAKVGTGNVGVLFDVWHHYTAHGTLEEMDLLTTDNVFVVHVNDAPLGLEIDEQQDLSRTLPMETGVIPAPAMMKKLAAIGYTGPVIAEPFSARINDLAASDPKAAATETAESIKKLFAASGISSSR
jgi:sugar phosphate isomerase/epimerase